MPGILNTILIVGGALVVILLVVGVVISISSERSMVEQRLKTYLDEGKQVVEKPEDRAVLTEWLNKRVERSSFGDRIARELARADLKFKVAEYFALHVITVLGGALIMALLSGFGDFVSPLIGGVLGLFAPRFYVKRQQGLRLRRFNEQLSDMLNLMVNGLRAGYSTMQAMEAVSKEMPPPMNEEFRRVVQEMQLGIPMEIALNNLLRRIPSEDLDFVITAINVQREVGGNLSEILDIISFTIRERVRIKGEIRVMTAQVRTSGTVLALIPVGLTLMLWLINKEYLLSFFDNGPLCGWIAISVIVIMIVSGYFAMMKIADIEV
ncbi:MAG: type II secretion system F family protein [Anaerolineales bacterium]